MRRVLLALVLLLVLGWFLLHTSWVQNWLVDKVAGRLSKDLGTEVKIDHIDLTLLNKMKLRGVLVRDKQKDTLLYAGGLHVNITDWFLFKREAAVLQYIGLEDAVVNLRRSTGPEWNYQFIVDHFSGPPKSKDTTTQQDGLQFDLKKAYLSNVRFSQLDGWVGKDLVASIKKMELLADTMDFAQKRLSIQRIELTEPLFAQRDYPGRRIKPTTTGLVAPPPTATAYRWNNAGWVIKVGELQLIDGRFVNEKQTDRPPFTDRFDGQHLSFNTINARLQQVRFQQDTLRTHITLSTQEKSGLNVKKLEADMRLTPTVMEFDRLDLRVNKSRLGDYYAMRYTDFNDDMADFLNSVVLEGRFQNSEIYSDDLAIFAPALKSWKRVFSLSGNARGSISNLSAKKMLIKSGNTLVDGDLTLRGLPNIQQTFIDFKGNNLQTNYTDLVTWIPTLKNLRQPRLQQLGAIGYRGNFTGFINDFVTYGTFNTGLGKIVADLNMKLPTGRPAIYSGSIATEGFQLGRFLEAAQLGKVSFNGKIKGTGFRLRELQANFDGQFKELEMGGQRYQNLVVSGDFENKQFRGTASINDPKLQVEELTGSVDFNGPVPRFDFDAWLTKAQLQPLGLAKEELDISGRFKLNFTGNNIDNFLGSARIFNASLLHDGKRLSFDSLALISEATQDGAKKLSLRSNEANADISGRFKILQLPDAFKLFLNKYYPAYIQPPVRMVTDQEFAFTINTGNVDEYVQLFDKRLKGFNNAEISGSVHLTHNELALTAKVPQMSYDGKTFTGIRLNGLGTADTLSATVLVDEVAINDSLHFPGTKLVVKSHNDVSDISLTTSASKTLNSAELYASVQTMPDGVQIHFFPSSFIINEKKWSLEKDGELSLNKSYLSASGLKFVQGQQQITISTEPHEVKSVYNIVAKLTKVNVDDFAPFVVKKPRLEGVLDGEVTLSDPFGKPELDFRNTTIQNLRVDNNLIGNLTVEQGNYDIAKGIFNYKGKTVGANNIEFDGRYHTKDSTGNQLQTALKVGRINLSLLQPYLSGIFSDLTGEAVGELTLSGGKNRQYATGTLQVTNGSLKVNYTQCRYTFNNETILLNEDAIDFGKIELRDTLNNSAVLSGLLYHRFFQDFSFEDIRFSTNRLLLLNTGKKDNNQFYGKVIGNATLELNGPASNMRMDINGGPSTLESDSNHIYLPSSDSRETGALDYIDFIQFGSLMENELKTKEGTTILVDMNLTANPACKVDVILDEVTGDIIKGEGNGNLNIRVGNKENLSIRGRYDITQGEYAFNFQTVIKKPFKLSSGYINWTGNPYEADIKIDAEYLAPKVSLSTILASNQQSDIIIRAHLTETLKKPAIGFELLIPPTVDFSDKLLAERKLADFRRDPAEMNKQVSSLLIFGGFINTDQSLLGGSNPYNFAVGTIGQVLSSFLTNSFSRFLQKTLNDPNITTYFDITPSLNDVRQLQAAAKFGLVKTYLDNRLIITLGGNLDYNNPAFLRSGTNNLLITPDFSAEWLITRDGKLRVVGFRRSSIDQVLGQRNRQGISLTYKREFDGF